MSAKDKHPTINRFVQLTSELPSFAGMRTSGNPASLPPFLFRVLENVAMRGNDLHERGGQEKYNPDTPLDDCGDGFLPPDEEPDPFGQRMLIQRVREGQDAEDPAVVDLRLYASGIAELTSALERPVSMTYIPGTGPGGSGGRLFWSAWAASDENGDLILEFSLDASDNQVTVASGIGCSEIGTGGEVASFDGSLFAVTLRESEGLGVHQDPFGSAPVLEVVNATPPDSNQGPWLREFAGKLCTPLDPEIIYRRSIGSAGWDTSATLPGGCQANLYRPSSVALFDGDLYFTGVAGGFYALMSLDSAGTTALATLVTSLGVPSLLSSPQPLCVHNGVLWMAAGDALAYWTADGTLVEFPTSFFASGGGVQQLISFRGRLWALLGDALWSSRYPHSIDSWVRASLIPGAFGYGLVHPIL